MVFIGVFYIDGVPAGTFNPSGRPGALAHTSPFRVGCRTISLSGFYKGRIDDVAFHRRTLGAGEIAAPFSAGSTGKIMGLVPFVAPYTPAHATQPVVSADAIVTNLEPLVVALDGYGPDYANYPILLGSVSALTAVPGGLRTPVTAHEDDPLGALAMTYDVGGSTPVAYRIIHAPKATDGPQFQIVRASAFNPADVPPEAAGTVAIHVDGGLPGALYVLLATPDATAFPEGPYGGATFDPALLSLLIAFGPPFFGVLDDDGSAVFAMPDLNLGLEFFGVVYAQDPAAAIGFTPSNPQRFVF